MRWRWGLFWVLLAIGLGLSVVSVIFGSRYGFLFLLLPLIFPPFRIGKTITEYPELKRCRNCDYESRDPRVNFCPRDGSELLRSAGFGNI